MEYRFTKPQRKFRGPVHWGHTIELYCAESRMVELQTFLTNVVGENQWRIIQKPEPKFSSVFNVYKNRHDPVRLRRVKFLKKDHAVRMKLMWDECDAPELEDYGYHFIKIQPASWNNPNLWTMYGTRHSGKSMVAAYSRLNRPQDQADKCQLFDYETSVDFSALRPKGRSLNEIREKLQKAAR